MMDRPTLLEPIHLADEHDFSLGPVRVRPSRGIVLFGARAEHLEPRVMQVLVALAQAGDEVVSRDTLIARCWGGRIVGEDALNRVLGRLRALSRQVRGAFEIETVLRVGYLLHVAAQSGTDEGGWAETFDSAPAAPGRRPGVAVVTAAAVGVLAMALAAAAYMGNRAPVGWEVGNYELLVAGPDDERSPDLSPDGRILIYTMSGPEGRSEVWSRPVAGGEPMKLAVGPSGAVSPAWSPDGDSIAFVRPSEPGANTPCSLHVKPYPAGLERLVGRCGFAPWSGRLSWTPDGRGLVYAEWMDLTTFGSRVRRMDIETGRVTDLTRPTGATPGDHAPVVSPDGRRVAFVRRLSQQAAEVFVLDLDGGRLLQITRGAEAAWVDWTDDGRDLLVASARAGPSELWIHDAAGERESRRLVVGLQEILKLSVSGHRLAFETRSVAEEIVRLHAGDEIVVATGSTYATVDVASDGTVGFVSTDPQPRLWLQSPREPARRLRDLPVSAPRYLVFSPSGTRMSLIAEQGDDGDIYLVDRESGRLTRLASPGTEVTRASWTADERALVRSGFDGREGGIARLEALSEANRVPLTGVGWPFSQVVPEGVFGVRADRWGVWKIEPGREPVLVAPDAYAGAPWVVARGAVHVLVYRDQSRTAIMRYPLDGGVARELASGPITDFAVDPRDGSLVVIRTLQQRQDIGLLTLTRR